MDAELVRQLPRGPEWQYEPKWDGFRCLAFRDGKEIELQAKSGKSLTRYFPDVVSMLKSVRAPTFVIDSELVIPVEEDLSFEELQLRLHPAESRVRKLCGIPGQWLPARGRKGPLLVEIPLKNVKASRFFHVARMLMVQASPATTELKQARERFRRAGSALDGSWLPDLTRYGRDRTGIEIQRSAAWIASWADSVITKEAGRPSCWASTAGRPASPRGVHFLDQDADRKDLTKRLEDLRQPPGFTGRAPGGPSRWSSERSGEWEPLKPELVVEVAYDHFTGGRFRHGTKFMRWRPDKAPMQCKF
jgi:hypothetical protein